MVGIAGAGQIVQILEVEDETAPRQREQREKIFQNSPPTATTPPPAIGIPLARKICFGWE
jgi:hypothetical protein